MHDPLPIDEVLPPLMAALSARRRAVLEAPPGAGKTTRVPLALLEAGLVQGRIVMLEPRRLAARAAAERMARTLGEEVGATVGYRIRGETRVSPRTRIEVVTEGILTRMIQSDPALDGIGAILFDEFHERSLQADLGLALTLEVAGALREDLMLLVMSATLDGAGVAALLGDAPVIRSQGRNFPVATHWLDRPLPRETRLEEAVARLVETAVAETTGGILVFLPGEGEIRRAEALLTSRLPGDCRIRPLYGAMDFRAQRAAIAPETGGRKVVLATSIAETSLTIEDIRVVVDSGRARRARFDPGSGMSRLVTERVTLAEAEQRRGRAGRVAEGVCYRLWTRGEEGALRPYPPAGIEAEDLASLALEVALWGARDPAELPFLTAPNPGAYAAAVTLLQGLDALDGSGAITDHGRRIAALPLHPRLAHMLTIAGSDAAPMAALLSDRDPLRGAGTDLALRLAAVRGGTRAIADASRAALDRIRAETQRLARLAGPAGGLSPAEQAALAYPDRIGLRRPGDTPRWLLSGGKGVTMDAGDPLASQRLIVVTDTDGDPTEARVRAALAFSEAELRALFGGRIVWTELCEWSRREGRVIARRQERLGALVLADRVWSDAPPEAMARAMCAGIRELGLSLPDAGLRFRARVALLRAAGADFPDLSDEALLATLEDWLGPYLPGIVSAAAWKRFDPTPALKAMLSYDQARRLDREVPANYETPLGRQIPIDYSGEAPEIAIRLQEMFGVTTHPVVADRPLRITLLSPAQRPVQTTTDLPGFWANSYADVRKDMRGRYPRHPWPDDPTEADPTLRAKPRGR